MTRSWTRESEVIQVPHCLGKEWLDWFRWHATLAGTGAILGPSRGLPEVGPRVVECLPTAPSLAGAAAMPSVGPSDPGSVSPPEDVEYVLVRHGDGSSFFLSGPPDPGVRRRH